VDNVLAVFSPSATIGLVEITGVTGCLGLELGLALLGDACLGGAGLLDSVLRSCVTRFRRNNRH